MHTNSFICSAFLFVFGVLNEQNKWTFVIIEDKYICHMQLNVVIHCIFSFLQVWMLMVFFLLSMCQFHGISLCICCCLSQLVICPAWTLNRLRISQNKSFGCCDSPCTITTQNDALKSDWKCVVMWKWQHSRKNSFPCCVCVNKTKIPKSHHFIQILSTAAAGNVFFSYSFMDYGNMVLDQG